jgi:hypothetical protein
VRHSFERPAKHRTIEFTIMKNSISCAIRILTISAVAAVGLGTSAFAGEDIAVAKLPEVVTKAIGERFPKAELINAEKETDKGKLHYEVKIRAEGALKEVDVSPEGKILKVKNDK